MNTWFNYRNGDVLTVSIISQVTDTAKMLNSQYSIYDIILKG